jgi:hypothetical protein
MRATRGAELTDLELLGHGPLVLVADVVVTPALFTTEMKKVTHLEGS